MSNLNNEQLEKLPTPRLLALYKKNQKHIGYIKNEIERVGKGWRNEEHEAELAQHEFIKSLLDKRENVE